MFVPSDATSRSSSSGQSVDCPWAKQVLAGPLGVLDSVGLLVQTTTYLLCAGTLCWPCVAPCSSKMDRLDDGAGSSPAEHY